MNQRKRVNIGRIAICILIFISVGVMITPVGASEWTTPTPLLTQSSGSFGYHIAVSDTGEKNIIYRDNSFPTSTSSIFKIIYRDNSGVEKDLAVSTANYVNEHWIGQTLDNPDISIDGFGNLHVIYTEFDYSSDSTLMFTQKLAINSGFRPNPDGYHFDNFAESVISWDLFKNTYGVDEVEIANGVHSPKADEFYNSYIKTLASGGSCFGMAATSNRVWSRNISQEQTWNLGTNRLTALPQWTIFSSYPFLTTTTDWIENHHIRQMDIASLRDEIFLYKGSTSVYNIIKSRILNNNVYKQNPLVLGIYFWDYDQNGKMQKFGHAVVPIRIVESEDQKTGRLYIYDVNYNGEEKYIDFDLVYGTAYSPEYGSLEVAAVSQSAILQEPDIPNFQSSTLSGHLLFTDPAGNHLGYYEGTFESEIPNAMLVEPLEDVDDFPETYYLDDQVFKTELIGNGTGIATATIMRPNALVEIDAGVMPSSKDEIRVPESGSSVEFISGAGTSSLQLMLDKETTDDARMVTINGFGVEPQKVVNVSFTQNRDDIKIFNSGEQKNVNFSIGGNGTNSGAFSPQQSVTIEASSSILLTPADWSKLSQTSVQVKHDVGNDGTIDYSETIYPHVQVLPLPGFTNPPTDPDSDGLYEDLNANNRKDFNDVVLMFNQMQWIAANEPVSAFDFNGNGRIDFNDIVKLFGEI
jgi:PKD repeat protein